MWLRQTSYMTTVMNNLQVATFARYFGNGDVGVWNAGGNSSAHDKVFAYQPAVIENTLRGNAHYDLKNKRAG